MDFLFSEWLWGTMDDSGVVGWVLDERIGEEKMDGCLETGHGSVNALTRWGLLYPISDNERDFRSCP